MVKEFNLQFFSEEDEAGVNEPDDNVTAPKQFTQEEIDKIVQTRLAQAKKKAEEEKKKAIDEALAKETEKLQAQKLKEMSEAERHEEEFKLLKAQLEELKLKDERSTMAAEVRRQLADKKISVSDKIVDMLVAKDAETTNSRLKDFTDLYLQAVEDGIKAKLKGKTPQAAGKKASLTREALEEKLKTMKDPVKRQALIKENMELFQ